MDEVDSSDEESSYDIIDNTIEDIAVFNTNYEEVKKGYISKPFLTKFEKTKIISERSQQLSNGAESFLKNSSSYSSVYEIAIEELKQKKLPFIIKRPVANNFEYWKLDDFRF
jgi:DNA-directed RNA polymerase subunit K/omega|tara:strand:+ start:3994 stop:4329 length:336 start_codon:yes stop_codon:yes gene_type:complete